MQERQIVIVADAGREAGLGHISRSTAVAVALRCHGFDPRCYARGAEQPFVRDGIAWSPMPDGPLPRGGVLIADSYRLAADELESADALVVMHDYGDPPPGASMVVSVAADLEHVALRPGFWGLPRRELRDLVERVLVTVGAGRFESLGRDVAHAVARSLAGVRVTLVRGPHASVADPTNGVDVLDAPESLVGALLDADLVVTAGGQTMLEAAAAGTPAVVLPLIDNQQRQVDLLARLGAVRVVDPVNAEHAARSVATLAADAAERRDLSRKGQDAVDGYGALRIAFHIARMARP